MLWVIVYFIIFQTLNINENIDVCCPKARRVILRNVRTDLNLNDIISLLVNLSCELRQIIIRYDCLWARRVILNNVQTNSNLT